METAGDPAPVREAMDDEVRATRRSIARFLRALHFSGHAIAGWPPALVSRLAHADAVTARYLSEPERVELDQLHAACAALTAVVKAMVSGLNLRERARLRAYELAIRIDNDDLHQPLVQPHRAPEEDAPSACEDATLRPTSLRSGLGALEDGELAAIARRLGASRRLRPAGADAVATIDEVRAALEHEVTAVLRDDHLIGILIATLPRDALELLSGLVRHSIDDVQVAAVLSEDRYACAVGEGPRVTGPAAALEQCGLAFRGGTHGRRLWVPTELCHRLDGVLRALGV